jgi:hypothetical protein
LRQRKNLPRRESPARESGRGLKQVFFEATVPNWPNAVNGGDQRTQAMDAISAA